MAQAPRPGSHAWRSLARLEASLLARVLYSRAGTLLIRRHSRSLRADRVSPWISAEATLARGSAELALPLHPSSRSSSLGASPSSRSSSLDKFNYVSF